MPLNRDRSYDLHLGNCHQCQPNLTFVDVRVDLDRVPLMNLHRSTEIFFIDSRRDGIEQITEILSDHAQVQSLQLIGAENDNVGSLKLGLSQLNLYTLEAYLDDLSQWRSTLSTPSAIVLYGCLVTVESVFNHFLQQLAGITGADIGAFVSTPDAGTSSYSSSSLRMAWQA